MFSSENLSAIRENFNERFSELSKHNSYLNENLRQISALALDGQQPSFDREFDLELALGGIVCAASQLGYYIGLHDGASALQALANPAFPELMLKAGSEWTDIEQN